MSTVAAEFLDAQVAVPEIVITEPSPLIRKPLVISNIPAMATAVPSCEECPGEGLASEETGDSLPEQISSPPEQERDSSSEFSPAEDCVECVVSVPEVQVLTEPEPTSESSATDPDEFGTYGCCNLNTEYEGPYEYVWNIVESRYAIPFWLLGIALPVSAGVMGAIYMFSCPAASSLPNMIFMIGVSLMAVFTLRICIIIHRMTWEDENSRSLLQTLNLICLFITFMLYITESATFWQMKSSTNPIAKDFCHPTFSTYGFWWNAVTSVFMIVLLLFPIA